MEAGFPRPVRSGPDEVPAGLGQVVDLIVALLADLVDEASEDKGGFVAMASPIGRPVGVAPVGCTRCLLPADVSHGLGLAHGPVGGDGREDGQTDIANSHMAICLYLLFILFIYLEGSVPTNKYIIYRFEKSYTINIVKAALYKKGPGPLFFV